MNVIFLLNLALADTVFLGTSVHPADVKLTNYETLWATQEAQGFSSAPIRDELVQSAADFLEQRISTDEYEKLMLRWSQNGWSEEERFLLLDVLTKTNRSLFKQQSWECRLKLSPACPNETLVANMLPENLQDFEWLVLDGRPLPREQWHELKISKTEHSWLFLSSKYKSITFDGSLSTLQKQKFQLTSWVKGTCESFQVDPGIQNMYSRVYFSSDCTKPTLLTVAEKKNFYEKYKKPIWWTIGAAVGAGLISSMAGKKVVIQKPGFM